MGLTECSNCPFVRQAYFVPGQGKSGDIAIVVPLGQEHTMEDYDATLQRVRKRRAVEEKKAIRQYVSEHPELVEKVEKKVRGTVVRK